MSRRGPRSPLFTPGWRACAYKTASGRRKWLNRDPLGSSRVVPGTDSLLDNELWPFEYWSAGNLYHFVFNNPVKNIDPLGLDIFIIRDNCSKFGHEVVIGGNGDGTYWESDKMPGSGPLAPVSCPANISFRDKSSFDPNNLGEPPVTRSVDTSSLARQLMRVRSRRHRTAPTTRAMSGMMCAPTTAATTLIQSAISLSDQRSVRCFGNGAEESDDTPGPRGRRRRQLALVDRRSARRHGDRRIHFLETVDPP